MAKVIFLNRYFYPDHSATSQLLSKLAFDLADANFDVQVVASRQCYDNPQANLPATEQINGVHVHRCWTTRFGRAWLFGRLIDYLTYYISVYFVLLFNVKKADIVIAETDPPLISIVAILACKLKQAHLVNWLHDLFPEVAEQLEVKGFSGSLANMLRAMRNISLRLAKRNVVLGTRMEEYLSSQGIAADKTCVIHNWADKSQVYPVHANNGLRIKWGLKDKFVVGYSGNMGRVHDFHSMIHAATVLREESDIVFLFIGGGPQKEWVEKEIQGRGLNNVQFMDYQPEEQLAMSLSVPDVHLISLRNEMEGFSVPSKFYGIAAAGRPSIFIGSKDGEIARLINQHQCGLSVEQADKDGLATAIKWMASHPEEHAQMGANARNALEEEFDASVAIRGWKRLIASIWQTKEEPSIVPSKQPVLKEKPDNVCWISQHNKTLDAAQKAPLTDPIDSTAKLLPEKTYRY
jgi:colanic acid biosynthesis glycosyl transferase WcaI